MATSLRDLLVALDTTVAELVSAPAGDGVEVETVALLDRSDLAVDPESPMAQLYLHVALDDDDAERWFEAVAERAEPRRPHAVMSKTVTDRLRRAAATAGIALIAVDPRARWDHVFPLVQRVLTSSQRVQQHQESELLATDTDLFGLAQLVAQNSGGMVSIEDDQSRVLAYSASNAAADELRAMSILGREGPPEYLRVLRSWGVYDRLARSDEVVDIPAHPELRTKRRLVVSIRHSTENPRLLGTMWVQQGDRALSPDAPDVLRGAAAIAARIISRTLDAPSVEAMSIQRLLGIRGEGVDVPSVAGVLGLSTEGPAAVIGFAARTGPGHRVAAAAGMIRLAASAFRRDSVATVVDERAYVLLPGFRSADGVTKWTRQLVDRLESGRSVALRAAVAIPVASLEQVAAARVEVDRVLDGVAADPTAPRVTTLAESRTSVLLREILDLVASRPELADPRVDSLLDYDREHGAEFFESASAYLAAHGDVRAAAGELGIHPNTLRYRIRRIEHLLGIDLTDPSDRLLLELQLRLNHP